MNKKASHVGVILSFVVFVTFLVFIIVILQPAFNNNQNKENSLDTIKQKIMESINAEVITVTISRVEETPGTPKNCIIFNQGLAGIDSNGKTLIYKDSSGINQLIIENPPTSVEIPSSEDPIQFEYYPQEELTISQVYSSETDCDTSIIQIINKEKRIFEKEIENKINLREDELEQELGISEGENFAFTFLDENKNILMEREVKGSPENIYAQETPIEYLNQNAEEKSGYLIIKVW